MARPRKDSGEVPTELRIEEAFWTLIEEFPLREITVNMIVAEAQCARGSFYYHYSDVSDLVHTIIERTFPAEIPQALFAFVMTGKDETRTLIDDPVFVKKIDRLCLLVGPHSSVEVIAHIKKAIQNAWLSTLQFDEQDLPKEAVILLEFVVNGALGVLACRSLPSVDCDIGSCFKVVMPDIPEAFIRRLMSIMQDSVQSISLSDQIDRA